MAGAGKQTSSDLGSFKTQVLSSIDIVELIGRSVTLKRAGRDYKGLCPFHQEKTASFYVSPTKQYFNCYGCKANGNAIDFIMKRDRMEFIDALRLLGESLGLELPRLGGGGKQKSGEKQLLYEMQSAAGAFFARLLEDPQQGLAAREYLAKLPGLMMSRSRSFRLDMPRSRGMRRAGRGGGAEVSAGPVGPRGVD